REAAARHHRRRRALLGRLPAGRAPRAAVRRVRAPPVAAERALSRVPRRGRRVGPPLGTRHGVVLHRRAPPPAPRLLRRRALQRRGRRAGGGAAPPRERRRVRERGPPGRPAGGGRVREGERRGDAAEVPPAAVAAALRTSGGAGAPLRAASTDFPQSIVCPQIDSDRAPTVNRVKCGTACPRCDTYARRDAPRASIFRQEASYVPREGERSSDGRQENFDEALAPEWQETDRAVRAPGQATGEQSPLRAVGDEERRGHAEDTPRTRCSAGSPTARKQPPASTVPSRSGASRSGGR